MNRMKFSMLAAIAGGLMLAGAANAAIINVSSNITSSTTWTANNEYQLNGQIFVRNGATLTIQPGTRIRSIPAQLGSICITRGSKIIAKGTCDAPIIFTSSADNMTTWREAALEWGNITIEGRGYMSNTKTNPNNTSTCNGNNVSRMEGLIENPPGNPDVYYGGSNDDDDSGCLQYVSIRYGGRVIGVGDELNGLSLGAVGRETDIDHIEIMNNVDDGIEIWGGTVNLKYFSIWNIGDDSFDIDQGWRGKAQFGLIVQGYSLNASQGSGVGDTMCEIDGAEIADAQPVTRTTLYNFTLIGQPVTDAGDQGIEYRDGAGVQVRNFVIMDVGDKVIRNAVSDGEGSLGYGHNGTPTFLQLFSTPWNSLPAVNACANPGAIYQSQSAGSAAIQQGFVNEVTDTVFFRNQNNAYSSAAPNHGANEAGITIGGGSNAAKANVVIASVADADAPIQTLVRQIADADGDLLPGVTRGGKIMLRVLQIDPRAKNQATSSSAMAPNDGFFTPAQYRGAFSPSTNWLCGWTAADAYGFLIKPAGVCPQCPAPNPCPADFTGPQGVPDGQVNTSDLFLLLAAFGTNGTGATLAPPSNITDVNDLFILLAAFGACP